MKKQFILSCIFLMGLGFFVACGEKAQMPYDLPVKFTQPMQDPLFVKIPSQDALFLLTTHQPQKMVSYYFSNNSNMIDLTKSFRNWPMSGIVYRPNEKKQSSFVFSYPTTSPDLVELFNAMLAIYFDEKLPEMPLKTSGLVLEKGLMIQGNVPIASVQKYADDLNLLNRNTIGDGVYFAVNPKTLSETFWGVFKDRLDKKPVVTSGDLNDRTWKVLRLGIGDMLDRLNYMKLLQINFNPATNNQDMGVDKLEIAWMDNNTIKQPNTKQTIPFMNLSGYLPSWDFRGQFYWPNTGFISSVLSLLQPFFQGDTKIQEIFKNSKTKISDPTLDGVFTAISFSIEKSKLFFLLAPVKKEPFSVKNLHEGVVGFLTAMDTQQFFKEQANMQINVAKKVFTVAGWSVDHVDFFAHHAGEKELALSCDLGHVGYYLVVSCNQDAASYKELVLKMMSPPLEQFGCFKEEPLGQDSCMEINVSKWAEWIKKDNFLKDAVVNDLLEQFPQGVVSLSGGLCSQGRVVQARIPSKISPAFLSIITQMTF